MAVHKTIEFVKLLCLQVPIKTPTPNIYSIVAIILLIITAVYVASYFMQRKTMDYKSLKSLAYFKLILGLKC